MNQKHFFYLYIIIIFAIIAGFVHMTGLGHYLTLENLQEHKQYLSQVVAQNYIQAVLAYIVISALSIVACIPAGIPLAIISGFLFGIIAGSLYATIGGVVGSILSFIVFRYLLHNLIRRRYSATIDRLNARVKKMGMTYFLVLYYSGIVPFFVINASAALTDMSLPFFIGITTIGALPLNIVCAIAGSQLSTVSSAYDIFSPGIIILFAALILLACIPMLVRSVLRKKHNGRDDYDEF